MDPEILTPRLRLSRLAASDAPAMFAYRADPEVCRYQSFVPRSLQDVEEFIRQLQPVPFGTPGAWFQFAVRLRESDLLIGDLGTHVMADETRQVEIGFTLAPSYQGQGLATEAVSGLIGHLLDPDQKHRVFASVDPRNTRSLALLERVGMRQEAHFRESLWFKGEWADDVVYAVLATEWRSN